MAPTPVRRVRRVLCFSSRGARALLLSICFVAVLGAAACREDGAEKAAPAEPALPPAEAQPAPAPAEPAPPPVETELPAAEAEPASEPSVPPVETEGAGASLEEFFLVPHGEWLSFSPSPLSELVQSAAPMEETEGAAASVQKLTLVGLAEGFTGAVVRAWFVYSVHKTPQGPALGVGAEARCEGEGVFYPEPTPGLCVSRLVLKGGTLYWSNRLSYFHQIGKGKILGGTGKFANATGTQTEKRLRTGRADDVVWTFKIRRPAVTTLSEPIPLGRLEAGATYATSAFVVPLAFRLSDGWQMQFPETRYELELERVGEDHGLVFFTGSSVFGETTAEPPTEASGAATRAPFSVGDWEHWLGEHRWLDAEQPRPFSARIGEGFSLDTTTKGGDEARYLMLFGRFSKSGRIFFSEAGTKTRWYVVAPNDVLKSPLVIGAWAKSAATFDETIDEMEAVLQTVEFTSA